MINPYRVAETVNPKQKNTSRRSKKINAPAILYITLCSVSLATSGIVVDYIQNNHSGFIISSFSVGCAFLVLAMFFGIKTWFKLNSELGKK